MDLLKKGLNISLDNEGEVLSDNLMEVFNISDKYVQETKRELEIEITARIQAYRDPIHWSRLTGIWKNSQKNDQIALQMGKEGATVDGATGSSTRGKWKVSKVTGTLNEY
ncbi:unnamed protein product [Protopolystoma xenopodis]|uniref:Uncharacterized protein n=1 Tax=Protopolystoma xenopodis TaxID=117903 RepID=A0A448WBT5_9PLAT|nr:unnamed protein product [Protopolystoma xenopodis]